METFIEWLLGEAGAAWIIGISGLVFGIYSWYRGIYKQKRGQHVICTQVGPPFTHLILSPEARKSVIVAYRGEAQGKPILIETLSQVLIDIKLESGTEALNSIEIKFQTLSARVLRVWWEEAPEYLVENSEIRFYPTQELSVQKENDENSSWEIRIHIPQLKNYEKYKEEIVIGILADGDLDFIIMPSQGSTGVEFPNQVWTAEFVTYQEYLEMKGKKSARKDMLTAYSLYLIVGAMIFLLLRFLPSLTPTVSNSILAGLFFGFVAAGLLGINFRQINEARAKMRMMSRPLDAFPYVLQPKLTSAGIVRYSIKARLVFVFWVLVLIAIITLLIVFYLQS